MAELLAVSGALIDCPHAMIRPTFNKLVGTTDQEATGVANSILTETDSKVGENIMPFTCPCKKKPIYAFGVIAGYEPCLPIISGKWQETVKGMNDATELTLTENSTIDCEEGGTIEIVDPNQDSVYAGQNYTEAELLNILFNNFDMFDLPILKPNGDLIDRDGLISFDELLMVASSDNHPFQKAAQQLLTNSELFHFLDTGNENRDYLDKVEEGRFYAPHNGDDMISREDITAYVLKSAIFEVIAPIHSEIDIARQVQDGEENPQTDGILSRNDYEAYILSGNASALEVQALVAALNHGAVDGEQGVADHIAAAAGWVGDNLDNIALVIAIGATVALVVGTGGAGAALVGPALKGLAVISIGVTVVDVGATAIAGDGDEAMKTAVVEVIGMFMGSRAGATITGEFREQVADALVGGISEKALGELMEENGIDITDDETSELYNIVNGVLEN